MSRAATPSRILRRQLLQRPAVQQQLLGRRCYAADAKKEKEERETFRGQLYESTSERVTRDKAEQARFAEYRETHKARSSPAWLVPFGMWI